MNVVRTHWSHSDVAVGAGCARAATVCAARLAALATPPPPANSRRFPGQTPPAKQIGTLLDKIIIKKSAKFFNIPTSVN